MANFCSLNKEKNLPFLLLDLQSLNGVKPHQICSRNKPQNQLNFLAPTSKGQLNPKYELSLLAVDHID